MFSLLPYFFSYCEIYIHLHNVGKSQIPDLKHMGENITFGKLKISDLKHMGKNITFGIYKNNLQLNNMSENGPTGGVRDSVRARDFLRLLKRP